MRVLITGAGGFIGRCLFKSVPSGIEPIALLGPGDKLFDDPESVVYSEVGEITDIDLLRNLVTGCDTVIHLAGSASVAQSFSNPQRVTNDHVLGATVLCQAAQEAGVRRLIHVSSAEVYGRPFDNPVTEQAVLAPRSPYAAAKVGAEAVFSVTSRSYDMEVVILRPFSVYGPGQRKQSLLDRIIQQAVDGEAMTLYDLTPCRDYVHVEDLARALWASVSIALPSPDPLILNLASGAGTTVEGLARQVMTIVGRADEPVTQQGMDRKAAADIPVLVGCPKAANQYLSWSASLNLRDGLASTVSCYLQRES